MKTSRFLFIVLAALVIGAGSGSLLPKPSNTSSDAVSENAPVQEPEFPLLLTEADFEQSLESNPDDQAVFTNFRTWYASDPDSALGAIDRVQEEQQPHAIAGILISAAENAPDALPSLIESLRTTDLMVRSAFETLAQSNIMLAIEISQSLHNPEHQPYARYGLVSVLASRPIEEAFEILSDVENAEYRLQLTSTLAQRFVQQGEIRALDPPYGDELTPGIRDRLSKNLIKTTAKTDPLLVAQWIHDGKFQPQNPDVLFDHYLMPQLAHQPATLVMEVLAKVEDREKPLIVVLSSSSEISQDRVKEFLELETSPDIKRSLIGWYGSLSPDVETFRNFVDEMATSDDHRTELLKEGADRAMQRGRLDYAWLICSLADDMQDTKTNLLRHYGWQDPIAATTLLSQVDESLQSDAIKMITSDWANRDPRSAVNWLREHTETYPISPDTYYSIADTWIRSNPRQTSEWVDSLPTGAVKDAGIKGMIPHIMRNQREAASAWIDEVNHPEIKAELTQMLERSNTSPQ